MDTEGEIRAIKERNQKVEADKAWEVSLTRRLSIAALTYICAAVWLYAIGNERPLVNATVPVGGFLLSTLTMSVIKKHWQN